MKLTTNNFRQSVATLSRDKLDTLLLVSTCTLVLLPFAQYCPLWLNLAAAGLIVTRIWITLQGYSLPKKWQLTALCAALSIGVYLHFHTWLGRDAGIALLITLVCLKMLELHARRDAVALVFVCYFLLAGNLMYSQSLPTAIYLLFCVGLLLSTQFTFQYYQLTPQFSTRILSGFKIVGWAIPLALVLFLFFPRIQGPLWGKQQNNLGSITGLSDSMEPGNVAELAQSDQIAFRVKFHGKPPASVDLYWRAVVLDTFNGSRWSVSASDRVHGAAPDFGQPVTQEIIMEPHNQHWLFGLDHPLAIASVDSAALEEQPDSGAFLTAYGEMRSPKLITDRIHYSISSVVTNNMPASTGGPTERRDLQNRALQLPPGQNPLTMAFAEQLRLASDNPTQLAMQVLQYFRQQPFRYTLAPPPLGTNQVDEFMFGTRAGFCEHYASAFVVIMRAMHVPARVVTGYQGGEQNPVDGLMTVRQSDAHAWAEIWVEGRGWLRFDPTAAVAPNRVERGINASFPNRNLTGLLNFNQQSWLGRAVRQLRSSWDAINSEWNLRVLNYTVDKQLHLLSDLSGIEHPQAAQLGMTMMLGAFVIVAALSLILLGRRTVATPLDRIYSRFCSNMARRGVERGLSEGPIDYAKRLAAHFPDSPILGEFLQLFARCKYGKGYNPEQLVHLKKLLQLCLQLKTARNNIVTSDVSP